MASTLGNHEIARRYATAFFALAKEQSQVDRVAADLQALGVMMAQSADFAELASNATLKRKDQARAVLAIADAAQFSPLTRSFLGTLAEKRRLNALTEIIKAVQGEIAAFKGEVTAEVTSAQALDKAQADTIAASLKKALGANVKLVLTEDAALMGGLVVKVGSKLIDSSVRTKLERLTRALKTEDQSSDKKKMKEVA